MKTIFYRISAACIALLIGTGFSLLFNMQGEAILVRYYDGETFVREEIEHLPATLFYKIALTLILAVMIYVPFHIASEPKKPITHKGGPNEFLDKDP